MIDQVMIAIFGVSAVAITQSGIPKLQKWAGVFGLIGQPFWFYSAYTTKAWGIFFLSFLYTASWGYGFYKHWIKNDEVRQI